MTKSELRVPLHSCCGYGFARAYHVAPCQHCDTCVACLNNLPVFNAITGEWEENPHA